jgi:hypothetical protein
VQWPTMLRTCVATAEEQLYLSELGQDAKGARCPDELLGSMLLEATHSSL